jgi:hypothetical protein
MKKDLTIYHYPFAQTDCLRIPFLNEQKKNQKTRRRGKGGFFNLLNKDFNLRSTDKND